MATPFIGSFSARPQVALDTSRIQELGADRTTLENQLKQRQLGIAQAKMVGDVSNNLARTVNQQRLIEPEIERLNRTLDSTVDRQNSENDNQALQHHLQYQGHLENRARILDSLADRAKADAAGAKAGALVADERLVGTGKAASTGALSGAFRKSVVAEATAPSAAVEQTQAGTSLTKANTQGVNIANQGAAVTTADAMRAATNFRERNPDSPLTQQDSARLTITHPVVASGTPEGRDLSTGVQLQQGLTLEQIMASKLLTGAGGAGAGSGKSKAKEVSTVVPLVAPVDIATDRLLGNKGVFNAKKDSGVLNSGTKELTEALTMLPKELVDSVAISYDTKTGQSWPEWWNNGNAEKVVGLHAKVQEELMKRGIAAGAQRSGYPFSQAGLDEAVASVRNSWAPRVRLAKDADGNAELARSPIGIRPQHLEEISALAADVGYRVSSAQMTGKPLTEADAAAIEGIKEKMLDIYEKSRGSKVSDLELPVVLKQIDNTVGAFSRAFEQPVQQFGAGMDIARGKMGEIRERGGLGGWTGNIQAAPARQPVSRPLVPVRVD